METLTFLFTSSFYPPYHIGGDATHVKYLAEELAKKGHEIHVFHSIDAYRVKRGKQSPPEVEKKRDNIFIHSLKSPIGKLDPYLIYATGNSLWAKSKYSQLVKTINPNIVHHHNLSLLGYGLLKKQAKYLSLYTAHDYWLICPTNNLFKNKAYICDQKSCASCSLKSRRIPQIWRSFGGYKSAIKDIDLLISPSEFVRNRLIHEIDRESITLPNFAPFPPSNIPRNTSFPEKYFLSLGMLEKHKGILQLLDLFKEIHEKVDSTLVVAGC
jgi:glycosyltransferase involved in cell wall biosynthesis